MTTFAPTERPRKKIDDEVYYGTVAAHGRHGSGAHEMTDNGNVGGNEQLLQYAAQGNGQGEHDELAHERPVQHVDVLGVSHHFLLQYL